MKEKIWDLKPAGDGAPVLVPMHGVDANEAISRHPERYTRIAPEGTVEHDIEQKRVAKERALAELKREENEELSKVAREKRDAVDGVNARKREEARQAEDARVEREKAETPPNRDGELQQIEAGANQEAARIRAEFEKRRLEIEANPPEPTVEPVEQPVVQAGDQS